MFLKSVGELLISKRFFPFFLCGLLGIFIDNLIKTAFITVITYKLIGLSDTTRAVIINLSMIMLMIPLVLLSPIGGTISDKYNKSQLIKYIRLLSILYVLLAVLGFYYNNFMLILLAIFLGGCEIALFNPVKYAILPELLKKDNLIAGNSVVSAGVCIGILSGIILGGAVISDLSDLTVFAAICLSFAGIAFISSLFIPDTKPANPDLKLNFNLFSDIHNTIKYAKKDNSVFLAILGISWFWVVFAIMVSQLPILVKDVMYSNQSVLVMIYTVFSVSMCMGALFCNKLLSSEISTRYVATTSLLTALSLLLLWYTSTIFIPRPSLTGIHHLLSSLRGISITVNVFLIGFLGGIYVVPLYALMQSNSKKAYRSRVIAANSIVNAFFVCCATTTVILLFLIGVHVTNIILILAISNIFTAAYTCKMLPDTVIKNMMRFFLRLIYRVEVVGMENYHKAGDKVLIVSNHTSFLDPILLGAIIPKRLVFSIDPYIAQSWWIKPFLLILRASYVDMEDEMTAKKLISRLKEEKNIVMFPEGRITRTGSLMKIYEAPGMIADKAGAKLLPIRIEGFEHSLFSRIDGKTEFRLFPKIKVTILEPQEFTVPANVLGRERRKVIGNKLYDIMSNMMFKGDENPNTIFESLIASKEQFGSKKVIIEDADRNRLTYSKLIMASFAFGKKIHKQTKKKEYIGIMLPNTAATVITFMGCQLYGRVPSMINFSTGVKNILSCCKTAKTSKIYTSRRFVEKGDLHDVIVALEKEGIKIIYLEDVRRSISPFDKLKAIWLSFFPRRSYRRIHKYLLKQKIPGANDPAAVLFTSGSEGKPKGVVLSHANMHSNLKQLTSRLDINSSDVAFNALPPIPLLWLSHMLFIAFAFRDESIFIPISLTL